MFADDLKLVVNTDKNYINDDIALLEKWEEAWLLKFNPTKCKYLHIDKNNNPKNSYKINGVEMQGVEFECDLGLHTDNKLNWDDHIRNSIAKANKMIAWIARNVISRDMQVMLLLYKTVIRPHLEYCVQVWSPTACCGSWPTIIQLENVQRKYTRLIDEVGLLPYSERLAKLKLTTLAERRLRGDLIETFKINNGVVDYGSKLFKWSHSRLNIVTRTHGKGEKGNVRKAFFSERVRPYWNKLPTSVKKSKNVEQFKVNLAKFKTANIYESGNYWEVSNELIGKIEHAGYLSNKNSFNSYVLSHPSYARRHGYNTQ